MCLFEKEHPHAANRRWYEKQEDEYNRQQQQWDDERKDWWFKNTAFNMLFTHGPIAWFKWTFLQLDQHDPNCRWRRLVRG